MLFLQDEDYNVCLLGRISSNCMVRVTMCFSNTFSHPELIYVILVSFQWGKTRFRWRSLWLVKLPGWWWSYLGCANSKDMLIFTPKRLGKKMNPPFDVQIYIFFFANGLVRNHQLATIFSQSLDHKPNDLNLGELWGRTEDFLWSQKPNVQLECILQAPVWKKVSWQWVLRLRKYQVTSNPEIGCSLFFSIIYFIES